MMYHFMKLKEGGLIQDFNTPPSFDWRGEMLQRDEKSIGQDFVLGRVREHGEYPVRHKEPTYPRATLPYLGITTSPKINSTLYDSGIML